MSKYVYESSATRRRKKKFERFYRTFTSAPPCVEAHAKNKISTTDPMLYLKLAVEREKRKQGDSSDAKKKVPIPYRLQAIVRLQSPDGRWMPSEELYAHLGAPMVPDPPEDIVEWRWCTALVVAFLRRNPKAFDGVRSAHDRAFEWVGGDSILKKARKQLPPLDINPNVDVDLVKRGQWQKAQADLLARGGHTLFLPDSHVPRDAPRQQVSAKEEKEPIVDVDPKAFSADLWRARTLASIGRARVKNRFLARAERPYEESFELYSRVADELQNDASMIEALSIPFETMRDVLGEPIKKKKRKKEKEKRADVEEKAKEAAEEKGAEKKTRPATTAARDVQGEHRQRTFSAAGRTVVAASRLKLLRARSRLEQCQQNVVERIMRDEEGTEMLRGELQKCERAYRGAVTHKERNHAFDDVTKRVNALRLVKAAVTESVAAWRKACGELASVQGSSEQSKSRPFLWNGGNYLLDMITSLDFLASSGPLAEWYGDTFALKRNPFMLPVALDEHPPTPRSAMERVIIGGEEVVRVNAEKAKQRERDADALDEAWKRIKSSPAYLPACDEDQFFRMRNAERMLLDEEHAQSKRVREAYLA